MMREEGMESSMKKDYTKPELTSRGNLVTLTRGIIIGAGDNGQAFLGESGAS